MPKVVDTLLDFSQSTVLNGDILSYLKDALGVAVLPGEFAPDPIVVDPLDDVSIDTSKWYVWGAVTEGPYLGRDCLIAAGPLTPSYDSCGVIYKPVVPGTVGTMFHAKFIMTDNIEWLVGLQEYAFTVDNVVTPTTWTLKYSAVQVPDNSTYIRFRPGKVEVKRGGVNGQTVEVPNSYWWASHPSDATKQYPVHVAFVFTLTGFQIWVHQPGVWSEARLVHTEVRSTGIQPVNGYSVCVNKYTSDSQLGFYHPSTGFRNDCVVQGAAVMVSGLTDLVQVNTLRPTYTIGGIIGQNGFLAVRFPTLGATAYTLEQIRAVASTLSGAHRHPIEFVLSGDIALKHPSRINVLDQGLTA